MKKRPTSILGGLLAAGLFFAPASARAEGRMGGPFGFDGMGALHVLLRVAQPTPDQRRQIHEILSADRREVEPIFKQQRQLREQMADRIAATGSVDRSALDGLAHQLAQLDDQLAERQLDTALRVRALLTPEQLARVAEVHQKMKALHDQMRALVPEGPMGPMGPEGPDGPPPPCGMGGEPR